MSNHRAEIEIAASEFREAAAKAEPGLWSKITQRPLNAGQNLSTSRYGFARRSSMSARATAA